MPIKYSMYSNGTVVAHTGGGELRKATSEEVVQHLATFLPAEYKGENLESVMFNADDGCVYGKYASKKVSQAPIQPKTSIPRRESREP